MSTDILPPTHDMPTDVLYRRLFTSTVVHVIDPKAPVLPDSDPERPRSLCGVKPYWPGVWIEMDTQFAGTFCRTCDSTLEALVRDRQP